MHVPDLVRESTLGQIVYYVSGRRLFRYAEEKDDYQIPERYARASATAPLNEKSAARPSSSSTRPPSDSGTAVSDQAGGMLRRRNSGQSRTSDQSQPSDRSTLVNQDAAGQSGLRPKKQGDPEEGMLPPEVQQNQAAEVREEKVNANLVDWYGPNDPECPMNWSFAKRCFVTFDICLITFAIYIGSAIYSPATDLIAQQFGISDVAATLGLTLFVLGYGVGPMFLSPLSEIPQLGRTFVYIATLTIFVAIQVPTALCENLGALLPLRFLAGFVGSPPLATGGASLADMWGPEDRAVVIGLWGLAAICGPVLGPLIGGFAAQANGWRWTIWPLLWLSGAALAFLFVLLPETSSSAILYRRAVRLRRLTGNQNLKSEGEIESEEMTLGEVAKMTLVRPFVLAFREPIVASWNLYIMLVYGILYIFIQSFEVVFVERHGFNLGQNGLAFMGLFVGALVVYMLYVPYFIVCVKPKFAEGKNFTPEDRLPPAMVGAFCLPISLFWFGWTASSSIPWIVPIIGSSFFSIGTFLLFNAGLNYLQDCYPKYAASVLAGNDLFRASVGAGFPLFSTAFFHNEGVGQACSILGGISIAMIPIPFVLYRYGHKIRARSRYAQA
ncbi:MFS general substrate transporter [Rhodofomes roseus]|uniref:MFS general substrate transporter n=1 Tax=Rhodofomes roseus TaxID=34475 RepID=A0ABQ8K2W3_9APHY|nr:MFS general substrate transporter [Rhodofomes roseus]KAH9831156.1 MFS general substrate transporter [Rhodofomes roseus]